MFFRIRKAHFFLCIGVILISLALTHHSFSDDRAEPASGKSNANEAELLAEMDEKDPQVVVREWIAKKSDEWQGLSEKVQEKVALRYAEALENIFDKQTEDGDEQRDSLVQTQTFYQKAKEVAPGVLTQLDRIARETPKFETLKAFSDVIHELARLRENANPNFERDLLPLKEKILTAAWKGRDETHAMRVARAFNNFISHFCADMVALNPRLVIDLNNFKKPGEE